MSVRLRYKQDIGKRKGGKEMSIKEQALKEYSETTCKNQWYICQCMFMFNKLKDIVEPENGKKFQERGYWFKCLTDNVKHIRGQFIGHPEYIFKKATIEDIKNHTFKDEKKCTR